MCIAYDFKPSLTKVQGMCSSCYDKDYCSKKRALGVICVECKVKPASCSNKMCQSCYNKDSRSKKKTSGVMCIEYKVKPRDGAREMCGSCYTMNYSQGCPVKVKARAALECIVCNDGLTYLKKMCRKCYNKDSRSKKMASGVMCIECKVKPADKSKGMCRSCYKRDRPSRQKASTDLTPSPAKKRREQMKGTRRFINFKVVVVAVIISLILLLFIL